MQSLLTLLTRWSAKAWVAALVAVFSCGTATVFYLPSATAGSNPTPGNPTVTAVQAGRVLDHGLGHQAASVVVVPEASAGLALIPVVAAVLFFSTRRLWPARGALAADGQTAQGAPEPHQNA